MFVRIWKFVVRKGFQGDFEGAYGPSGSWVNLLKRGSGYLRTSLLRDRSDEVTYLTIDRWNSKVDFDSFLGQFGKEYEELDETCKLLLENEVEIGSFDQLS